MKEFCCPGSSSGITQISTEITKIDHQNFCIKEDIVAQLCKFKAISKFKKFCTHMCIRYHNPFINKFDASLFENNSSF